MNQQQILLHHELEDRIAQLEARIAALEADLAESKAAGMMGFGVVERLQKRLEALELRALS